MTVKFEAKTTMSDALMQQASHLYSAMVHRSKKIVRLCVGVLLLAEGGLLVWGAQPIGWVMLVGGAYMFLAVAMTTKVIYHRTSKANGEHLGIITTIRFEKDRFTVTNRLGGDAVLYTDVKKIGENKEAFCIVSGKGNGTHMPKDSFTVGTADEFRAFIEGTTGKKIKTYR